MRKFSFVPSDEETPSQPKPSERKTPETVVRLVSYRTPYIDEAPRQLNVIAQRLIAHFLPLFLNPAGPALVLLDEFEHIDLRAFFRDHFQAFATERRFKVGSHDFTLSGFRLRGALADHHEIVYAAHFREVISERLAKFLPILKNRLADADQGDFFYLAFVQGALLNEKVNNERTDFSIPKDAATSARSEIAGEQSSEIAGEQPPASTDLFADDISLKAIRDAALVAVTEDLKQFLDEINTQKEAALTAYIDQDAPQYRVLMKYKAEFIDQIAPQAGKTDLEMALHRQLYNRQVKLKAEGLRILAEADHVQDAQEYYVRFRKFVEDENESGRPLWLNTWSTAG